MRSGNCEEHSVSTIVIRNADWVIAWDKAAACHTYRRNIDVAFADDRITFLGRDYGGPADRVIDGKDRLVLPGLIDIHSHPEHEPLYRGVREEHGVRNMHMTGLYERSQAFPAPDDEARAASRIRVLRAPAERSHLARRHFARLGRLDRAVRQKRHARFCRPRFRLGALAARQ
jgi:imidazolonepropionase-like amidohydrolase